eukprot:COSAG01_NODE_4957_length_4590_cov_3.176130_7_plen_64_part_00
MLSNQQCVDFVRLKLSLALGVVVCARLSRLASPPSSLSQTVHPPRATSFSIVLAPFYLYFYLV